MADTTYTLTDSFPGDISGFEQYSEVDKNLIESFKINNLFDSQKHFTELHIYSLADDLLESESNYNNYTFLGNAQSAGKSGASSLTVDPIKDSIAYGYPNGGIKLLYHFINDLFTQDKSTAEFFINGISDDRTELRLLASTLDNNTVEEIALLLSQKLVGQSYFDGFRLNFGSNDLFIGINIGTLNYNNQIAVTVKLYEPLPENYDLGSTLNIVEVISDSVSYEVATEVPVRVINYPTLRSPNFNIDIQDNSVVPSQYLNYNELFSYPVNNSNSQIYSVFNEKGIEVSVDYTDYNDFVHFSSAQERLINFKYKLDLVTSYSASLSSLQTTSATLAGNSGSTSYYNGLIQGIVSNFDHYERFLYYDSGSSSWPKTNNTKPYINAQSNIPGTTTPNSVVTTWYSNQVNDAAYFDSINNNLLVNTIPTYLRDDPNNENYLTFIHMIGQHFDNLWLYGKAVSDKYDADNRLDFGISRDLVAEALKNFGVQLYTSNRSVQDLFTTIIGQPYQSGSEQITDYITGSYTGSNASIQPSSYDSYQKEVYKRIYHNLPLLLSSKGTERGLRALINCFGIPSDILQIKLYGGRNTNERSFYGDYKYYTSSLDKIRLDNTGSIVTGSTLSNYVSIIKRDDKYTDDLHPIEVGFSPTDNVDNYISSVQTCINYRIINGPNPSTFTYITCQGVPAGPITVSPYNVATFAAAQGSVVITGTVISLTALSTFSSFNIDDYIGDPRNLTLDGYYGFNITNIPSQSLSDLTNTIMSNTTAYNVQDYVRLIKFFDNTVFKMIKDFIPARSVADVGIIIKPHILSRSKAKSLILSGSRPEYSGSIDTAFISGSNGGAYTTSTGDSNTAYIETVQTPNGLQGNSRHSQEEARLDGQLLGSSLTLSTVNLNEANPYKETIGNASTYNINFVSASIQVCTLAPKSNNSFISLGYTMITSSIQVYYGTDFFEGMNSNVAYTTDLGNTPGNFTSTSFPRYFNATNYSTFNIKATNNTNCVSTVPAMFATCSLIPTQYSNTFTTVSSTVSHNFQMWWNIHPFQANNVEVLIDTGYQQFIIQWASSQFTSYVFNQPEGTVVSVTLRDRTMPGICYSTKVVTVAGVCQISSIAPTNPTRGYEFSPGNWSSTNYAGVGSGAGYRILRWLGRNVDGTSNTGAQNNPGIQGYFNVYPQPASMRYIVYRVFKQTTGALVANSFRAEVIVDPVGAPWGVINPNTFTSPVLYPGDLWNTAGNNGLWVPVNTNPKSIGINTDDRNFINGNSMNITSYDPTSLITVYAYVIKAFNSLTVGNDPTNIVGCTAKVTVYRSYTSTTGTPTLTGTYAIIPVTWTTNLDGTPITGNNIENLTMEIRTNPS